MKFTKMHGLGNDFVMVDGFSESVPEESYGPLARFTCDRHFGIGADGLVFMLPSRTADFRMRIYNADGSEADQCGNAIRCVGKYLYDYGLTRRTAVTIETKRELCPLELRVRDGEVVSVRVDMGEPRFRRGDVPMAGAPDSEAVDEPLQVDGETLAVTGVAVGNPNCVTFVEDVASLPIERIGPLIEHHPAFPHRTNVEFIQVVAPDRLRMRVWERGVGVTLACGSGACAALAAAVRTGRSNRRAEVHLDGGPLLIEWLENGRLAMTGPATVVYTGEYALPVAGERPLIPA
jgi:diaminopimelate epimerase